MSAAARPAAPGRSAAGERLAAFIRLSRFKFLLESLITVILGLAVSVHAGRPLAVGGWLLAQGFVSGTHLMTHYCNEYFDYEADTAQQAPTGWTGGSRVLAQGLLSRELALAAGFVMLFAMFGLVAAMPDGGSRAIGAVILALAWFYTAPPIRLNYIGLGEVTTSGVLTVLTPLLTCRLQNPHVPGLLFAVCVPLFLVMAARMTVMNLVDHAADLLVGKHTVATVLGVRGAALAYTAVQAAAYGSVVAMTALGTVPLPVGVALLATVPLAWTSSRRLLDEPLRDSERAEGTAFRATVHAAATGYSAVLGMVIAAAWSHRGDRALTGSVTACIALLAAYTAGQVVQQVGDRRRKSASARTEGLNAQQPAHGALRAAGRPH